MTRVIACSTNKGGEGKTTTTINLAEYMALVKKKNVLMIDLDPQANLSGRYIRMEYDPAYKGGKIPCLHSDYNPEEDGDWDGRSSIANIFYGESVVPYPTNIANLELLPSHSQKLQDAEAVTRHEVVEKVHLQLRKFIHLPGLKEAYDAIIIDTPPSKGPLTIAAIKAATDVVIPAQMEQFSIEGIYGMLQLWKIEALSRPDNEPINLVGILPNQVRNIKIHTQFYEQLCQMKGVKDYVIPHKVYKRAIYTEILAEEANPKSIFEITPDNIARKECESVCEYITQRIFNHV